MKKRYDFDYWFTELEKLEGKNLDFKGSQANRRKMAKGKFTDLVESVQKLRQAPTV